MSGNVDLVYDVEDRPPVKKNLLFALQQFLAILAATILVPVIVNGASPNNAALNQAAALVGAGAGTLIYLLLTKMKSPVFLGSSFAFIPALCGAVVFGYLGIMVGAVLAGLVYVLIAVLVKFCGTAWVDKYMPPIIIGPTVALIGFSLAGSAINNVVVSVSEPNVWTIIVGICTFLFVAFTSTRGAKSLRLYPFILGIAFGYVLACVFTLIGDAAGIADMKIMDFSKFDTISDLENWSPYFLINGIIDQGADFITDPEDYASIAILFVPIAFVVFAEHIADHKNLGSIIGRDLIKEPGLHRTLLGDGIGSMVGAFFGGCPNTTYGESIGCVALSRNASTWTILFTAIMCIIVAFIYPFIVLLATIPSCVIGGICIALYGYIAVSGLRMFKDIDLNDAKNLFVVAAIFIVGIGICVSAGAAGTDGLVFGKVTITAIASGLIVGIVTNLLINKANPYIVEKLFEKKSPNSTDFGPGIVEDEKKE